MTVDAALREIRIPRASPSWLLIMQSGVDMPCTVGIPVAEFLTRELGASDDICRRVDAVLLDGMPVDDIAAAIVPDGARLAFAAGLPGIAGLAMKRGSAVRALRGGITHRADGVAQPRPGRVTLFLYSLAIRMLGDRALARGVAVAADQFRRYARFAPDDLCRFDDGLLKAENLPDRLAREPGTRYLLVVETVLSEKE